MPVVPQYRPNQVDPSPLPAARVTTRLPEGALPTGERVFRQADRFIQEERARAHEARMLELDRDQDAFERDRYAPAFGRMGKDAINVTADVEQEYRKFVEEREKTLNSTEQRIAWRKLTQARWGAMQARLMAHEGRQVLVWREGERDAGIERWKARAADGREDPAVSLDLVDGIIDARARELGWGPDQTAVEKAKHRSDLHARVIEGRLAAGMDADAQEYLDNLAPDAIDPETRRKAAAATAKVRLTNESKRLAEEYTGGETAPTRAEALERAAGIKDDELRDLTRKRINARYDELEAFQKARYEDSFNGWIREIEEARKAKGADVLAEDFRPAGVEFKETDRRAAAAVAKGFARTTNWDRYWDLDTMSDEELAQENLYRYAGDLAPKEFDELKSKQDGVRANKTGSIDDGLFKEIANDAGFNVYGKQSKEDKERLGRLKNQVKAAIGQARKGRKDDLSPEEKTAEMERILKRAVKIDVWGADPTKIPGVDKLTPDEIRSAYVPYDDVPDDGRLSARRLAEKYGVPITNDEIGKLYGMQEAGASGRDVLKYLLELAVARNTGRIRVPALSRDLEEAR